MLSLMVAAVATISIRPGDRIALCGDSITEQKQYSRIIETYLRVCTPELKVDVRQFGWSGETWSGFLSRVDNDVLRFKPTLVTTDYGMNDHSYRAFDPAIAAGYERNTLAGIQRLKAAGARVLVGSPNSVGRVPGWAPKASVWEMNDNLRKLSALAKGAAAREQVGFADVNSLMTVAAAKGKELYGVNYCVEGGDGVHPGGAGHMVMAFGFLKGLGCTGDLGTISIQLGKKPSAVGKNGHRLLSYKGGTWTFESTRYPFCIPAQDVKDANTLASGATLVPFQSSLNRMMLIVKGAGKRSYRVQWGAWSQEFSGPRLEAGINLAEAFSENPFSAAFQEVDQAVAAKQEFETNQIKTLFRVNSDTNNVARASEQVREQLVYAINTRRKPVVHTLRLTPVPSPAVRWKN